MPKIKPDRPGAIYPGWEGVVAMGGKPSKGTKKDKRLKENKPKPKKK
jgi:hypothetical protein